MMAGFGWEIGAFESWDVLGVEGTVKKMKEAGFKVASWVEEMLASGAKTFYKIVDGKRLYYDVAAKTYKPLPGGEAFLVMKNFEGQTVWKNSACRLYHLGDEVLGLEWNTKMGTIGGEVLEGIQRSIGLAEERYKGLVIAGDGTNFSAGANVGLIFMLAIEQDYDELDMAVRQFQSTMMRARYSAVPVVIAPHGLTLGGACELSLHADRVVPAAESYIGLVELGVGLIPGGGGTKEFTLRAADEMHDGEPETITLKNRFFTIATAKVSTSAYEAFDLGILKKGALYAGIHAMWRGQYATDHDVVVAKKLAFVMCGGDLSEPALVSEQYILDLEREAFLSLCGEKKTLERIQSVLKGGKPIRN